MLVCVFDFFSNLSFLCVILARFHDMGEKGGQRMMIWMAWKEEAGECVRYFALCLKLLMLSSLVQEKRV